MGLISHLRQQRLKLLVTPKQERNGQHHRIEKSWYVITSLSQKSRDTEKDLIQYGMNETLI